MTEREAINEILLNINELPLDDTDLVEDINIAVVAQKTLTIARKQILSMGWDFNQTTMSLSPNISGYIPIPASFLSLDGSTDADAYTVRDHKLFDKSTLSYIFETSVECSIVEDIVFDDIPYSVANYIVKSASLMAYSNIIGDVSGIQTRDTAMKLAKIDAVREDANKIDGNILTSTYATTLLDRSSI